MSGALEVTLTLDRAVLFPGNRLSGAVRVRNVGSAALSATALLVKVKGKELVGTHAAAPGTSRLSCVFLRTLVVLAGAPRRDCPAGAAPPVLWFTAGCDFSYPFELLLPMDIPGTAQVVEHSDETELRGGSEPAPPNAWGAIDYCAKAICLGTPPLDDPTDTAKQFRLARSRARFVVLSMMPRKQWERGNPVAAELRLALIDPAKRAGCCCCWGRGAPSAEDAAARATVLRVAIDRTIVAMDRDCVHINIDVDNRSGDVAITALEVVLHSQATLLLDGIAAVVGGSSSADTEGGGGRRRLVLPAVTRVVPCEVPPGAEDRVRAKLVPVPHTPPSQLGHLLTITHAVSIHFVGLEMNPHFGIRGKGASEGLLETGVSLPPRAAAFGMQIALTQSVDDFDVARWRDYEHEMYSQLSGPEAYDEFTYIPPAVLNASSTFTPCSTHQHHHHHAPPLSPSSSSSFPPTQPYFGTSLASGEADGSAAAAAAPRMLALEQPLPSLATLPERGLAAFKKVWAAKSQPPAPLTSTPANYDSVLPAVHVTAL